MVMGELPTSEEELQEEEELESAESAAEETTELLVIGGGPGGYAAAFRAADLGLKVTLACDEPKLGGVCLLRGCIPSKTLLHLAELIHVADEASSIGIDFGKPQIDLEEVRAWKDRVIERLAAGLKGLCRKRGVRVIRGHARFDGSDRVRLDGDSARTLRFEHAIIASGSRPVSLPGQEFSARIMASDQALELADAPGRLLVVGGGYVGLELGLVYAAFGSRVTLVEMTDRLMANADADLVEPLAAKVRNRFEAVHLNTKVARLEEKRSSVRVTLEGEVEEPESVFDRVLIAIGRRPHTDRLGLDTTEIETDERGAVLVDEQRRTAEPRIFAIGDAAAGMFLAHEAMHEGRVAAEAIAGEPAAFDPRAIPAVVYTDPQIAWCGLTEREAKEQGREIEVARFPWSASGRALSMGSSDGLTKILFEPRSQRVLGVGIVGRGAESLISEGVLAVEMGAVARDLAMSIHPHPTLSETLGGAAQALLGSPIDLPPRRS